jgi:hypothetical protein
MPYTYRLYLSVVDPEDNGKRTLADPNDPDPYKDGSGPLTYTLPIEARERLSEPCVWPGCGKSHDILYTIQRRASGTLGHFPVFKINRSKVVVDVSLPTGVITLPKDAVRVTPERAARLWHDTSGLHEFGASDPSPVHEW